MPSNKNPPGCLPPTPPTARSVLPPVRLLPCVSSSHAGEAAPPSSSPSLRPNASPPSPSSSPAALDPPPPGATAVFSPAQIWICPDLGAFASAPPARLRLLDSAKRALFGTRPWPELLDRTALSRPESLSDATARLRKNLGYFRVNYAALVALSLAAALLAASTFVVFLTSVGSLIFSALALGAAVVCAHGAFRVPEDLFLDEPDQASGGSPINLLSFITNTTGGRV